MNWDFFQSRNRQTENCNNLVFIIIMIILNFTLSAGQSKIDSYGHLGGLLNGFFLGFIIIKPFLEGNVCCCSHKIWMIVSISFAVLQFIGGFILLYTAY
jgi:hypothetical protein